MSRRAKAEYRGEKEGYCNICRQYSKLTRDHIPPQGCVKPRNIELRTLTQYLSRPTERPVSSQSGLNVLSICGNCNNKLLGTEYDPVLIEATKQVVSMMRVQQELGLSLPEKVNLSIKPQRLLRSVVGHILAGKLPEPGELPTSTLPSNALRNYFLDQSNNLSDKFEVYYWVYPSNQQIVINSLGIGSFTGEGFITSSYLLKFFPLAFWIVWDRPDSFLVEPGKIPEDKFKGLDDTCEILLDLRNMLPLNYPEIPDKSKYVMYHNNSTFLAKPRESRGFKQYITNKK